MGNMLGRRQPVVDEQYTRPQGLYQNSGIDLKRLRKLILGSKLAPCYPGDEEGGLDLEECPICFLNYPSLNRSRCCKKGICTECYLRIQLPYATRATKCPFCKASNYDIEYRGVRTKEEKSMEQAEEQRVIEAHIRKRQQEINDEKGKSLQRQDSSSLMRRMMPTQLDNHDVSRSLLSVSSMRPQEHDPGLLYVSGSILPSEFRQDRYREESFDVDLEDIMIAEAILLSIQDQGDRSYEQRLSGEPFPRVPRGSSPSGDLARGVATLAARQQPLNMDMAGVVDCIVPVSNTSQQLDRLSAQAYSPVRCLVPLPKNLRATWRQEGEWAVDHSSYMTESGTSCTTSDFAVKVGTSFPAGVSMGLGNLLPESFEEQMMVTMVVSVSETEHG